MTNTERMQLCMAGEYGVASELSKRGFNVSITIGTTKAIDIIISDPNNANRQNRYIEVKTSRNNIFVTGFFQKYYDPLLLHPDYWILVHIDKNNTSHYYILTHQEMGQLQMTRNKMASWSYINGVDNVLLSQLSQFEDCWSKIV